MHKLFKLLIFDEKEAFYSCPVWSGMESRRLPVMIISAAALTEQNTEAANARIISTSHRVFGSMAMSKRFSFTCVNFSA